MCELLTRRVDKVNSDPYLDSKCSKAGDVLMVQEDEAHWGYDELNSPALVIVCLPGVSVDAASVFLGREFDTDFHHPSRVLQRRAFRLDLARLGLANPPTGTPNRASQKHSVDLKGLDWTTLRIAKPSLLDPNVITGH